jgi:hypothetical protein
MMKARAAGPGFGEWPRHGFVDRVKMDGCIARGEKR